ncbi:MAG: outer membrane lipoprotein chaperone LolA [Colwellia sp.]|nr:outer membrane lipoprotein chaperone LolA [Colwellia sp.]
MTIKNVKLFALAIVLNFPITNLVTAHELSTLPENIQQPTQLSVNAKTTLMAKLANLDHFSANFTQEVLSESGEVLEQSSGKLAISKPNLAHWQTLAPDELSIVSDGTDVWFYNPWIEQVSVYSLSAAIAKTPILLLTSKDETLWQQYHVTQQMVTKETVTKTSQNTGDSFVITAKDTNSQIKSLTLYFYSNEKGGQLKQFSFLDATGQLSHIKLSDFDAQHAPKSSLFNFIVPAGVQVDDQR